MILQFLGLSEGESFSKPISMPVLSGLMISTVLEFKMSILLLPVVEDESPNKRACLDNKISACEAMVVCVLSCFCEGVCFLTIRLQNFARKVVVSPDFCCK
jgi:hypothetical protein